MKKKIIAFSLWGNNPVYNTGMIKNVALAAKFYPDWIVRIYYDNTVPKETILKLMIKPNVELVGVENAIYGMFWRFFVFEDPHVEYAIIRDADSRLDEREAAAVNEWIESNKAIHIIRDHPCHSIPIMGGAWGGKAEVLKGIQTWVLAWALEQPEDQLKYFSDQNFLAQIIYPRFKTDAYINDEFFSFEPVTNRFKLLRENFKFVGERYDENDNRNPEDLALLVNRFKF
jgi:protein O-GlcNAc transferase